MKILKIGAASDLGVHVDGASLGPLKILDETASDTLILKQKEIQKSKDPKDLRKNFEALFEYSENLYQTIIDEDADFVVMVGGDHSLAIPTALASTLKHPSIGLIWIDAHTDYHTLKTTSSGNLHGLPCACINGFGEDELYKYHKGTFINPKNTVIFGARSVDDPEWINAKEAGVTIITMQEIFEEGILNSYNKALKIALENTEGYHLSFDLDFLDPSVAKGVSTPVKNGADLKMLETLLDLLSKTKEQIVSFDLVEYNPLNDRNDETLKIAQKILKVIVD